MINNEQSSSYGLKSSNLTSEHLSHETVREYDREKLGKKCPLQKQKSFCYDYRLLFSDAETFTDKFWWESQWICLWVQFSLKNVIPHPCKSIYDFLSLWFIKLSSTLQFFKIDVCMYVFVFVFFMPTVQNLQVNCWFAVLISYV